MRNLIFLLILLASISAVSCIEETLLSCPDDNHPHAIDLGLPSKTKWSCCNIGANSPKEMGRYYAWGEVLEKSTYTQLNYKYFTNGTYVTIGQHIAGTDNDAAFINSQGIWKMPTQMQQEELVKNCKCQISHPYGMEVVGKNGGKIFIPQGQFWSCSQKESNDSQAYTFGVSLQGISFGQYFYNKACDRYKGLPIRAVLDSR